MKKLMVLLLVMLVLGCTQKKEFSKAYVPSYCSFLLEKNLPAFYNNILSVQTWYVCNSSAKQISEDFVSNMKNWSVSSKVVSEHLSSLVFYKNFDDYYEVLTVSVEPYSENQVRIKVTQAFIETIPETAWT